MGRGDRDPPELLRRSTTWCGRERQTEISTRLRGSLRRPFAALVTARDGTWRWKPGCVALCFRWTTGYAP